MLKSVLFTVAELQSFLRLAVTPLEVFVKRIEMILVLIALVAVCAGSAQADVIDPGLIIAGGRGSIGLTGGTFQVSYPGQSGCTQGSSLTMVAGQPLSTSNPLYGLPFMDCVFRNDTAAAFTNLQFNIASAQLPLTLQCDTLCSGFTQTPSGGTATFFFNPPIPASGVGQEFSVIFVNWADNTNFGLRTNVPEPGTLALLGSGLLALAGRLRRKRV